MECREDVGLADLAPELVHKLAFEGWLGVEDVKALGLVCKRLASILVWDEYGRDLHAALSGVMENVRAKRWNSARYAVGRRWLRGEDGEEESVWKRVAEAVVGWRKIELEDEESGWDDVMLAALSLPDAASGCMDSWWCGEYLLYGDTSLFHIAAEVGSEKVVEWVLERGGDVGARNGRSVTPLWVACQFGHLGVVKRLVEAGADVDVKDTTGLSTLMVATQEGHADVVAYVLGFGVLDVDEVDGEELTPLKNACLEGHLDVVRVLVEEGGVDVDVEGKDEYGPIYWACCGGEVDVVRLLVDAGSGSGVGKDGGVWVSGLVAAVRSRSLEIVRLLMGMGVDVDGVDGNGATPLCCASVSQFTDGVRVLLGEGGADVNKAGEEGKTPLHWACLVAKKPGIVRVLLEAGADVGSVDDAGDTPLGIARAYGCGGIRELVEEWL